MASNRLFNSFVVLSVAVVGCGGAEPKKLPTLTPAEQAEIDKQHAEMKAATPADAPAK